MIILKKWQGRLGNNIIQLIHILRIALFYNHNITFNKDHKHFDLELISDYCKNKNCKNENPLTIMDEKYNFFRINGKSVHVKIMKNMMISGNKEEEIKNVLRRAFKIKNIEKLDEGCLVVHIRSGDTFDRNPHPKYIPPPLHYYVNEINKYKYKKIIIVCEDKKNPVVNKLLELYKNSVHNINSLEEDIRIILGATNVIGSVGSFITNLLYISNYIKKCSRMCHSLEEYNDYYKIMRPWKNKKKQREYILSYKNDHLPDVERHNC